MLAITSQRPISQQARSAALRGMSIELEAAASLETPNARERGTRAAGTFQQRLQDRLEEARRRLHSARATPVRRPELEDLHRHVQGVANLLRRQHDIRQHARGRMAKRQAEINSQRKVDAKTQALMKSYVNKFYFDEDKIRRSINKQHRWDAYKEELLRDVITPRGARSRR